MAAKLNPLAWRVEVMGVELPIGIPNEVQLEAIINGLILCIATPRIEHAM